ncbi:hypothetical protein M441DRAFT_262163 [Trichoderma asperellum CBS 433.97]|uniref:Uncharacterized protein n=1 Tax=Trichoderma asperellum (strain ATCC 204424 / CBS 433.97 / NBRC 101777) TaxID=1042311 RepID=A0A2T3YX25_TRIA4|nr:hypothetical protein M441DRAFT_262163 [Trichoderma asperellum CBS 433.97]PTB37109.1 hypothetical protein M441DRAFT_262163 [Trichoderma asperellum CBS 433.97]
MLGIKSCSVPLSIVAAPSASGNDLTVVHSNGSLLQCSTAGQSITRAAATEGLILGLEPSPDTAAKNPTMEAQLRYDRLRNASDGHSTPCVASQDKTQSQPQPQLRHFCICFSLNSIL